MVTQNKNRLDRRQLLRLLGGTAALGALPSWARDAQATARADSGQAITPFILMVYCSGGWDPTMVFDPKADASTGYLGTLEPGASSAIAGGTNLAYTDHPARPSVKKYFETYGPNSVVVNGLSVGSMVTRYQIRNALSAVPPGKIRPVDWVSYYVASLSPVMDIPHAVIDAPYIPGDYTHVATRLTTATIAQYGLAIDGAKSLGGKGEEALAAFRRKTSAQMYDAAPANLDGEKYRALYYGAGREAVIEARLVAAQQKLGPRGGDPDFVRNGKIAVELFASGASLGATVQAGADLAWDTRTDHYARQSALYESTFAGLNKILAHAAEAGVADRTLVIMMSEGGRNPQLNAEGGKGPWAFTSMMMYGPGVAGGTTVGLTDAALRGLPLDPIFGDQTGPSAVTLQPENVIAALYMKTNVTTKLILPDTKPLSLVLAAKGSG